MQRTPQRQITPPKPKITPTIKQAQDNAISQQPVINPILDIAQTPKQPITETPIKPPTPTKSTNPNINTFFAPPPFADVYKGTARGLLSRSKKSREFNQPKEYSPTAFAQALNIRGKGTKAGEFTGFGIRPIKETKKKKRNLLF